MDMDIDMNMDVDVDVVSNTETMIVDYPMPALDDLPDNLLRIIFDRIDCLQSLLNVSRTCERFKSLVRQILDKRLKLGEVVRKLGNVQEIVYYLQLQKDNLVQIDLDSFGQVFYYCHLAHITEFPNIKVCNLIGYGVYDEMSKLSEILPNLKKLRVIRPLNNSVSDSIMVFSRLTSLSFSNCTSAANELNRYVLFEILNNLPDLKKLDIRTDAPTSLFLEHVSFKAKLTHFAANLIIFKQNLTKVLRMTHLTSILIHYDKWSFLYPNLNEVFVKLLHYYSSRLRLLSIDAKTTQLDRQWDQCLAPCIIRNQKLEELHINGWHLNAIWLQKYIDLTSLKKLTCRNWRVMNRTVICKMLRNNKELEYLDLVGTNRVDMRLWLDVYKTVNETRENQSKDNVFKFVHSSQNILQSKDCMPEMKLRGGGIFKTVYSEKVSPFFKDHIWFKFDPMSEEEILQISRADLI